MMGTDASTLFSAVMTTMASPSRLLARAGGVKGQTGIIEGADPTEYDPANPVVLFIIQAGIVIIFCQLLHYPLRLLNQPRVIAEVIGGIILGPSVMMRIPGFKETIFPPESMAVFGNVANLGLIIFLFLVALEVDMRLFTQNWKVALSVGLAGMILPFGLGFSIAWGLYHSFHDDGTTVPISFGVYGLFVGTALAITAFPVLCRILTELKLLRSGVGVTVLAAGIGNDVTGWILLALCVALVNNGSGLAALWALLSCIGWVSFLCFAVRPAFWWVLRRNGSIQNGPSQGMVALTLLMVLFSSWFTAVIGIHAIFGAFLVGLICPHEGGFAIKMTEKIEDLISVLFLPLYFALSGLSTDLGLLNDGMTWGYVVGVTACAFAGKIIGGTLAARFSKLLWRESFTIGCLMSCKGLVELIVLNIGLQARILSRKTFTVFVVMALVTTVATTPLTKALYPPWYQKKVEMWRRGEIEWDGTPIDAPSTPGQEPGERLGGSHIRRLLVYLRLDNLPSLFTFIALLGNESGLRTTAVQDETGERPQNGLIRLKKKPLEVHGLRIIELTDRTSSVMHVTEGEELYSRRDPVVNAFRAFSQLHDLAVSGQVSVAPIDSYAETLVTQASEIASDFALIPWSEYGSVAEDQSVPFAANMDERFSPGPHLDFIQQTLQRAARACSVGVFIDNGFGGLSKSAAERPQQQQQQQHQPLTRSTSGMSMRSHRDLASLPVGHKHHHVFFPFFGGADDRVALRVVLQLAKSPFVTAAIVHVSWPSLDGHETERDQTRPSNGAAGADSKDEVKSAEEDHVTAKDLGDLSAVRTSLPEELAGRVSFSEVAVAPGSAVAEALALAHKAVGQTPNNAGDIVVLGRRSQRLVVHGGGGSNSTKQAAASSSEAGSSSNSSGGAGANPSLEGTIGVLAQRLVSKGVKASILVVQAGGKGLDI